MNPPQYLTYKQFRDMFRKTWRQGQHVTVIGPTGCGKTRLSRDLVETRSHVVALGVKYKDDTFDHLRKVDGWKRINKWGDRGRSQRVLLWPDEPDIKKVRETRHDTFNEMMASVYKQGGWCIWSDELRYNTDFLGLRKEFQEMYIAGRSNGISLFSSAQRPSHVPLEAYSQASFLIMFRTGDERDLARVGDLNGASAKQVSAIVAGLPFHDFLCCDLMTGAQYISNTER